MCGICGIALSDRDRRVDPGILESMCRMLVHRGPDEGGVVSRGSVALGHRRLSIVDLAAGHQPMANEDESVWVSFNGEIYNHADFRTFLSGRGHQYRTRSDTECLLHLYEEYGWEFVRRLRGIFAFAIWDERTRTLMLARDAVGVKPLYYARTSTGDIVFSSEAKSILAVLPETAALDESVVSEYFANGFVAGDRTLFRGIRKLRPGHVLLWRDGEVVEHRYWHESDWKEPEGVSDPDVGESSADRFWGVFKNAVDSQLMSDVPLGVFLSGGVDSSLLVAAMRECGVERVSTFSVGFAEQSANELPYARVVAGHFGTDHHEVVIGAESYFDQLAELTWHSDMPLRFSASIPLYAVSRLAQESVKVVLAGEGADEMFGGYGRYRRGLMNLRLGSVYSRLTPAAFRRWVRSRVGALGNGYVSSRAKRSFLGRRPGFVDTYLEAFSIFDGVGRTALLPGLDDSLAYDTVRTVLDESLYAKNPLEAILRFDQDTYLEELLMKQDKMSMAASIESRVPFLDQTMLAWARSRPPTEKLHRGKGKYVVRQASAGRVPPIVLQGQKRGFTVPLGEWLRGVGRSRLEEYVSSDGLEPLDRDHVRKLMKEHQAGIDHTERLWMVMAFQVWRARMMSVPSEGSPRMVASVLA